MAPTFSLSRGFSEREENPSILAAGQDGFDFDDWNEQNQLSVSHWRNSCPEKRSSGSTSRWSVRLTSFTTRAKQLGVGESTQRAINQLRKSIVEASTRTEQSLRAVHHRFSEADIDRFEDMAEQPESEKDGCDEGMDEESSDLGCKFKGFQLSKSCST